VVTGFLKKVWGIAGLLVVASSSFINAADLQMPVDYSGYVTFDTVSFDRVAARQQYISKVLDEQKQVRTWTVGLSVSALLGLIGGGVYWYFGRAEAPQLVKPAHRVAKDIENRYFERRLALIEEAHTIRGMFKNSMSTGFGYAISSVSAIAAMALFDKVGLISFKGIKSAVYPSTADLCEQQEDLFRRYFNYLKVALDELERELKKVKTQEQFNAFVTWRGLLSADVQSSTSAIVRSVEDFTALSFEFVTRKTKDMPKEEMPLEQLRDFAISIDRLTFATNSFSQALEHVVNEFDFVQLERSRAQVGMAFKNATHTARGAMRQLVELVDLL
jgi:phage host-nuclease inhibitor protein Gam